MFYWDRTVNGFREMIRKVVTHTGICVITSNVQIENELYLLLVSIHIITYDKMYIQV